MVSFQISNRQISKRTIIAIVIVSVLLIGLLPLTRYVIDQSNKYRTSEAVVISPKDVPHTDNGIAIARGMTYTDLWGNESGHPPTDGTIKTWSFYPNAVQIVTRGDTWWAKDPGTSAWRTGSLKTSWASCTNFTVAAPGVDVYAINPVVTNNIVHEYIFQGTILYAADLNLSSGVRTCVVNGQDWIGMWNNSASPSGQQPFTNYTKIDQMQFLPDGSEIIMTQDKIWLIGANPSSLGCKGTIPQPWHFCEPETLSSRWSQYENHPPTDSIRIFALSYTPYYHIVGYRNYIWTLGENNVWNTFRSGIDGYGMREPFIFADNGKYYLYYDAMDVNQDWRTAIAVANSPSGPWTKLGLVPITGTKRSWEASCSCSFTVFKVDNKYYSFYLGAPGYFDAPNANGPPGWYHVPGFSSGYYRLGLAISDSPTGPFRRLRGDGTLNDSTASDPPLLSIPTSGWHAGNAASAMGSLLTYNGQYYYSFTTATSTPTWGIGIAKAVNNTILGPWQELSAPLIPTDKNAENSSIIQDPQTGWFLQFANAVKSPTSNPQWDPYWNQCSNYLGVGVVMYWTKDLFNWDSNNNYRMLAHSLGSADGNPFGCSGDSNFNPNTAQFHRGQVGLGTGLFVSSNRKVYYFYDGSDFATNTAKGQMFRNIYWGTLDLSGLVTPTPSATQTPSFTRTPTPTQSNTPSPTKSPTPQPTRTPTPQPTFTRTPTPTKSPTPTPTRLITNTPSYTSTPTRVITNTPYNTYTISPTRIATNTLTSTPISLPGDGNNDGKVDGVDFVIWMNHYGQTTTRGPVDGDYDRNGKVDGVDYVIWMNNYGRVR